MHNTNAPEVHREAALSQKSGFMSTPNVPLNLSSPFRFFQTVAAIADPASSSLCALAWEAANHFEHANVSKNWRLAKASKQCHEWASYSNTKLSHASRIELLCQSITSCAVWQLSKKKKHFLSVSIASNVALFSKKEKKKETSSFMPRTCAAAYNICHTWKRIILLLAFRSISVPISKSAHAGSMLAQCWQNSSSMPVLTQLAARGTDSSCSDTLPRQCQERICYYEGKLFLWATLNDLIHAYPFFNLKTKKSEDICSLGLRKSKFL